MKQFNFILKLKTNIAIILISISLISINSCNCNRATKKTITAAYLQGGYYLPFLIVEEDSLFNKYGYSLELTKFNDNSQMISSFINGNIDIAAQSSFTMFPIDELHPNTFKFIYGQYCNSYFFVIPKDSPIKSLKDLKGDTIGIWKSPTAEAFVKIILKKEGLDYDKDYKITRFPVSDFSAAMENKLIKVLFGFDILCSKLVTTGNYRYLEPDAIYKLQPEYKIFNGGGMINTKLINDDPEKAEVIKKVFFEALKIINFNKEHSIRILSKKLNTLYDIANKTTFDIFTFPNDSLIKSATATYKLLYDNQITATQKNENYIKNLFWYSDDKSY